MSWVYNNIRIYVERETENSSQIIARIQPLEGTTVLQIFGDDAPIYKFSGRVVGVDNKDSLKALINDGTAYTFSGSYFNESLYLKSLEIERDASVVYQTIDQLQSCYAPVYNVNLELYEG